MSSSPGSKLSKSETLPYAQSVTTQQLFARHPHQLLLPLSLAGSKTSLQIQYTLKLLSNFCKNVKNTNVILPT